MKVAVIVNILANFIFFISGRHPEFLSHSFSYENEMSRFSSQPDHEEVLVQLDGENNSVVYCSQCQLCNKTKENNVCATSEQPKNNNNIVDNDDTKSGTSSEKAEKVVETSETSRKTTTSSRVVIDCDAIVSVPHCDDLKSTNGKNVSSIRSKKKKKGRQFLYSNGASSDVKESSSQAGEKGSNDDEVSLHFNEIIEF